MQTKKDLHLVFGLVVILALVVAVATWWSPIAIPSVLTGASRGDQPGYGSRLI
jgi:hypothetical protein